MLFATLILDYQAMKSHLSLIIPCYFEEPHLTSYNKVIKELKKKGIVYELIFIDDSSTDNTPLIIKDIVKNDKNCRAIFHKKNVGRGGTVTEGIKLAKYEYTGFIDIDLEISEKYIDKFLSLLKENDVVIATRKYAFSIKSLHRIAASRGYKLLSKLLLGLPYDDTEAGYKFFRKSKILPVLKKTKDKKWFWDTEIVALSHFHNLKIKEEDVRFTRALDKKSTVKLLNDTLNYIIAIYKFKGGARSRL